MASIRLARLMLAALLALAAAGGCRCSADFDPGPVRKALADSSAGAIQMFALRVGTSPQAPRDYFIADPELAERIQVAFSFWALKTGDRLILIDCGFVDPRRAERWGIADRMSPDRLLAEAGLPPEAVTDVVITHRHWDHIGGLGLFPGARVWVDARELSAASRETARTDPDLHRLLAGLPGQQRLHLLEGIACIAPGVVAFHTGLHTPGAWAVAVQTASGPWVFASDEVPLYRNLTRRIPSGQTIDPDRSRALFEGLLELVDDRVERIVPGHDPAVYDRFWPVTDRVVRLADRPR